MTTSLPLRVLSCLIGETFRRALATRLFWLMLAGSAVCILVCLSAGIEGGGPLCAPDETELYGGDDQPLCGPNPRPGHLTLGFGALRVALFRDAAAMVHFLQVLLAMWVAGAAGTLLALVWTAGFLPEFLQRDHVELLLARPVTRRVLFWGQVLGVLGFLAFQAAVFVSGTWAALGLRTGVWTPAYLWSLPLLCAQFTMIYGVSAALAVWSRNTAVCALGAIVFWLVCFGVNSGREMLCTLPATAAGAAASQPAAARILEVTYWVLPKPVDLAILLDRMLAAGQHVDPPTAFGPTAPRRVPPVPALLTSLAFALVVLDASAWSFRRAEY